MRWPFVQPGGARAPSAWQLVLGTARALRVVVSRGRHRGRITQTSIALQSVRPSMAPPIRPRGSDTRRRRSAGAVSVDIFTEAQFAATSSPRGWRGLERRCYNHGLHLSQPSAHSARSAVPHNSLPLQPRTSPTARSIWKQSPLPMRTPLMLSDCFVWARRRMARESRGPLVCT